MTQDYFLSKKTLRAMSKYGQDVCERAYTLNCEGNGANTIGFLHGLTTQQADAAINAGEDLHKQRLASTHL